VSFSLLSAASFFDWSQSHCLSLHPLPGAPRNRLSLRLVFPFLTLFYGNDGTKFSKKAERRLSLCPQAAQLKGAMRRVGEGAKGGHLFCRAAFLLPGNRAVVIQLVRADRSPETSASAYVIDLL
jgi:hypothetical protein